MQSIIAIELYTLLNALYAFGWKAILAIIIAIISVLTILAFKKRTRKQNKRAKEEHHAAKATNSEMEFQKWRAEREQKGD